MSLPSAAEIARSLQGAWGLFLGRAEAMRFLDVEIDGFWRSFRAVWLVAPAYLFAALVEPSMQAPGTGLAPHSGGILVAARLVNLGLDWLALPVLLALAGRRLGIGDTYAAFIVARNWAAVLSMLPYAAVAAGFALGLLGSGAAGFLSLAILLVLVRYQYLVARIALGTPPAFSALLVTADLLLSLVLRGAIDRLFGL